MGVISISIPDDLLEALDLFSEQYHFTSRSDAFRVAIQALINVTEDLSKIQGEHPFLLAYVLHDKQDVRERFEEHLDANSAIIKNVQSYKHGEFRIYTVFVVGYAGDVEKLHHTLGTIKEVSQSYIKVLSGL